MKNLTKLLLLGVLASSLEVTAMVKPGTPDVNAESKDLEKDIDTAKAQGRTFGPKATAARQAATKQLTQRYLELGLKPNKTAAEQQEFNEIGTELKNRVGTAVNYLAHPIQ